YWFLLDPASSDETALRPQPALPELLTMVLTEGGWSSPFNQHNRRLVEDEVLPAYLPSQRWFAGKTDKIAKTSVLAGSMLPGEPGQMGWPMLLVDVRFREGEGQRYALPVAITWEEEGSEQRTALLPYTIARARHGRREGAVCEAVADPGFALAAVYAVGAASVLPGRGGKVVFERTSAFAQASLPAAPVVKRVGGEQSNTSILIDEYGVLKIYRRLVSGIQPEIEATRFLTEVAHFANTPPLLGSWRFVAEDGEETELGVLFAYVRNQGDAWTQALNYLARYLDEGLLMAPREARPSEPQTPLTPEATAHPVYLEFAAQLGLRTAELHRALCPEFAVEPAFAPEPTTEADLTAWRERAVRAASATLDALARGRRELSAPGQLLADRLLERRKVLLDRYGALLPARLDALKTRFHGDYHLGQVLAVQNDFTIIDFEGEPLRGLA